MQFQPWALSCFHSNVGTHVCLLDSAQHVPDSEVLGHFGWRHIPGRQQDAGSESSKTVSQGWMHWWELLLKSVGRRSRWCYRVSVTDTVMNTAFGSWILCRGVGCSVPLSCPPTRAMSCSHWDTADGSLRENGPRGHLLKPSGTWRKQRVEVCALQRGETHIWRDAFTDKFVLLHDISSCYNIVR